MPGVRFAGWKVGGWRQHDLVGLALPADAVASLTPEPKLFAPGRSRQGPGEPVESDEAHDSPLASPSEGVS